jgi:hypothetical protein
MRLLLRILFIVLFFCSCHGKAPDVSDIHVNMNTKRFEKDLFKLDSAHFESQFPKLLNDYPEFGINFLNTILNADPRWSIDTTKNYVTGFTSSYRVLYDTAEQIFSDFSRYENEIKSGIQYLKHYFPKAQVPEKIITYIGPLDGYGDILSNDAFIIGLQHHLGAKASFYQSSWLNETYPNYISRRFDPNTISVNCMTNIILDIYPEKFDELTLANQMIEKGKRLYLLSKVLPEKEEYWLIGYSKEQLENCYKNEAMIWELFIQNNLLQIVNNNIIKNYIGESPKTQELGESSPGNIGSFVGWQIVKKLMNKNESIGLTELMKTNPDLILEKAKYKP